MIAFFERRRLETKRLLQLVGLREISLQQVLFFFAMAVHT